MPPLRRRKRVSRGDSIRWASRDRSAPQISPGRPSAGLAPFSSSLSHFLSFADLLIPGALACLFYIQGSDELRQNEFEELSIIINAFVWFPGFGTES